VKIKDMEGFKTKKGIEHLGMDYLPRKQYTKDFRSMIRKEKSNT